MDYEVLKKIIEKLGPQHQVEMAIEECAELIHALNKVRRSGLLDPSIDSVSYSQKEVDLLIGLYGEIADVRIMLEQLTLIFDSIPYAVNQIIDEKIKRLAERYDL